MRIIRVFPRRTNATPDDELVRVNCQPGLFDEADEIHISVAFTWDIPLAKKLEKAWRSVAPIKIGGPALDDPGDEFEPGVYLKKGYVITSRGCPNHCWYCFVPKREGPIRKLEIKDGWNVQDNNLLACSDEHIKKVFSMLKKQPRKAVFSGGFDARRLSPWVVDDLIELNPEQVFFAYDNPSDLEPLEYAALLFVNAFPLSSRVLRCYVLCGYKNDSFESAEIRIEETIRLGFLPFAMLYRDEKNIPDQEWKQWIRTWTRPAATITEAKKRGWIK
jgi:hypothetical protein